MFTRDRHRPNSVFGAAALLIGNAVGAGIFALPYVMSKSGWGIGVLYILVLGFILLFVNLAYGEVVLSTAGKHQFPVYVEHYLGKNWKRVAVLSTFIGLNGALMAYVDEVGNLLNVLFHPVFGGSAIGYSILFWGVMALALWFGLRAVANLEKVLVIVMLGLVSTLFVAGWPHIIWANLAEIHTENIFLPYGVVLFALAAASAIPDMKEVLQNHFKRLQTAIVIGSIVPMVVYILFITVVVGLTGHGTTESSVVGLGRVFGGIALTFGTIFGIVTMSTSFMVLGVILKEVYELDFKLRKITAWLLVIVPPFVIVVFKLLTFIQILGISGALIGGLDGIMIMKMHRHLLQRQDRQSEFTITQSRIIHLITYIVFGFGIVYEIYVVAIRLS